MTTCIHANSAHPIPPCRPLAPQTRGSNRVRCWPKTHHTRILCGADVVIGHHAHICKGIEVYRGKPIYHGLGNFVTPSESLSDDPRKNNSPERLAWAKRRKKLFGFEPDPSMPNYLFHPESRNTLIARVVVSKAGVVRAGFIPCYIDQQVRPVPVTRDDGGQAVLEYQQGLEAQKGA